MVASQSAFALRPDLTPKEGENKLIVIKVGTSSLVRPELGSLNLSNMARICETVQMLNKAGHRVVIVSSGAVGAGCQKLGFQVPPSRLAAKQALAAVGQLFLMRNYEDMFQTLNVPCAQVLLTLDNLANREQYLNARNTFNELLEMGVVPVVNENDTVTVQELRFGDNDTLSAQVATLIQADLLVLLTDVDCLYTSNPKDDPDAQPIRVVESLASLMVDTSAKGTEWGTGGMETKLKAARIATAAGTTMLISHADEPGNIIKVVNGEEGVGTIFLPNQNTLKGMKRWILSVPVRGQLWLQEDAIINIRDHGSSLFSEDIHRVVGVFSEQDAVSICDSCGREIARGLVRYSCEELNLILGLEGSLAHMEGNLELSEVVPCDNLAVLLESPSEELMSSSSSGDESGGEEQEDSKGVQIAVQMHDSSSCQVSSTAASLVWC